MCPSTVSYYKAWCSDLGCNQPVLFVAPFWTARALARRIGWSGFVCVCVWGVCFTLAVIHFNHW